MKIIIAPDSFKESLSASNVAQAIAKGFTEVFPQADIHCLPVADGGEGTTEALIASTQGKLLTITAQDPLGQPINSTWGLLGDGKTAVIEMAAASGLELVANEKRNPLHTTTYGTGQLILATLDHGVKQIIVGLGGSATNDAGSGMLQALGARLLDVSGNDIPQGGGGLAQLASIDLEGMDKRLQHVTFNIACDVDNPLTGEHGASAVFGPQKGADAAMIKQLDANLAHFAKIVLSTTGKDINNIAGAGAAGGLGGGCLGFLNAQLKSGIDIVLDSINFDDKLANTRLVITGEGRIDSQTIHGKTPIGVSKRAMAQQIPVIALAGSVSDDAHIVHEHGIDALFSIVPGVVSLPDALKQAEVNLYRTAKNIATTMKLAKAL